MSADTHNCFNALNKLYLCAVLNQISSDLRNKNQCLINEQPTEQEGFINEWYQPFNENTTPILLILFSEIKMR